MIQIVVSTLTNSTHFYSVPEEGWEIDAALRCIVIGRGVPRTIIPLDNVANFRLERIEPPLAEQGRRLASEREDLIAQGIDPALLDVPVYPRDEGEGDPR